ncbi:MAG: thioredoxin family protein [Saprospiraceae bacterium]
MSRKSILLAGLSLLILGSIYAFTMANPSKATVDTTKIKWYTLEEATELNKTNKKKFAIDIYTSWCHWCKVMDKETFTDPAVIEYMNEHFYAIKFDAESKDNITFQGKDFKFVNAGRRGINTLAYFLLDGKTAYPTIVYLDEDLNKVKKSPGFKKPNQMVEELRSIESSATPVTGS